MHSYVQDLFGGVVYAGLDTDKYKYPIGEFNFNILHKPQDVLNYTKRLIQPYSKNCKKWFWSLNLKLELRSCYTRAVLRIINQIKMHQMFNKKYLGENMLTIQ